MKQDKVYERELLKRLAEVLKDNPEISSRAFNRLSNRIATERVYRRFFGTWNNAKKLAGELLPPVSDQDKRDLTVDRLKKTIVNLRKENVQLYKKQLTAEDVREQLFGLTNLRVEHPKWIKPDNKKTFTGHGVPVLVLSDWHIGEIVDPRQVFGVNEFNMKIAKERVRNLTRNSIELLTKHLRSDYPGLVLLLGGDFVSGDIHDELRETNEMPIMPVVLKTCNMLEYLIAEIHKSFPKIAIFCCPGNHGRNTKKVTFKNKGFLSFDWLIYNLLEKHFKDSSGINFYITPGDDIQYKIYKTSFRLTHGAQFRGGQGFLGHIAPVTRGEIRKRTAAESYGMNYDMLVVGHFHSYGMFKRVICNGSLIGYSEYSMNNNYVFERPQQALFIVHPEHEVTFSCPVFCTTSGQQKGVSWISVAD